MRPALAAVGYEGTFFPKPDSPALNTKETNGPDGCAMFYKTAKFDIVKKDTLILKNITNNVATNQVCVKHILGFKESLEPKQICIATTHLKAKHGYEQLRRDQGAWLLEHLEKATGKEMPLIVCGDFNADPNEPVISLFGSSSLGLKSVYKQFTDDGQEPPYTTWKIRDKDVCRTIDYMWYRGVSPKSVLELPTPEQVGENRLPGMHYPSDHISLAADFDI